MRISLLPEVPKVQWFATSMGQFAGGKYNSLTLGPWQKHGEANLLGAFVKLPCGPALEEQTLACVKTKETQP